MGHKRRAGSRCLDVGRNARRSEEGRACRRSGELLPSGGQKDGLWDRRANGAWDGFVRVIRAAGDAHFESATGQPQKKALQKEIQGRLAVLTALRLQPHPACQAHDMPAVWRGKGQELLVQPCRF